MADKNLLITGATGNQGGAVINAILASRDSSNATIFAVTRNVDSAGAKALVAKSPNQIRLIKGDLTRCQEIFDAARAPISGVFCVSVPPMGIGAKTEVEEVHGKALVDAAFANGVKHFVFTSVDRGPDSDSNETDVPHFITKARIEKHLKEKFVGPERSWTILRPVAFMENFESMGKVFPTAWNVALSPTTKLQLVSTADIGWYAAQALLKPKEYSGRSISLAGDELTYEEVNDVFKKTIGKGVPTTFGFVGSGLLWAVKDVGLMFKFFEHTGYAADIPTLRKEHPELLNFSDWMKKSKFATK